MTAAIEVDNFSFQYRDTKRRAIKDLTFSVEESSFFCIVGANGSGKSTICNALVGLIPHYFVGKSRGEIHIFGSNVSSSTIAQLSANIGLVFQNPFNQLSYTAGTVAEELAYGLGNHGVPHDEMVKRVKAVSKLMRIDNILDKNPLELSGGQVQRVAFGSTFIMEPRILVLDECTTQLDPLGSEEIFDIVKRLKATGITVVMVDHDMERVARYADKVMVLEHGGMVALDTPQKVFSSPELRSWGIEPPAYMEITHALCDRGFVRGEPAITEEAAIEMTRKALK